MVILKIRDKAFRRQKNLAAVFCILWWEWCIHCKNGAYGGLTHERLYRRAGSRGWELYYRNESNRATDGEEVWDIEIYGTYGSNNIERFVWVIE